MSVIQTLVAGVYVNVHLNALVSKRFGCSFKRIFKLVLLFGIFKSCD